MHEHDLPRRAALALLLGLTAACGAPASGTDPGNEWSPATSVEAPADEPWSAPPLVLVASVRDGRSGARLSLAELYDRLATADVVFLGETHLDESTHRLEAAVLDALLERRGGRVVLSLEMFERDVQATLDDYLAGAIDEEEFLAEANPWSNYRTAYRRLVERAREAGIPVVAANFPAQLRRRIAMEGEAALETLSDQERALLPAEFLPNRPEYWRRVDNAVRGHRAMMGWPRDPGDPRLYDGQSLWDNAMGAACATALEQHPGTTVLHVNGAFHTQYWDGTAHQLRLRAPDANVLTVDVRPSSSPHAAELRGAPVADYVVFVEARTRDVKDGFHAVRVGRDLRYRLHVPESASPDAPVPLFVWLGGRGATAEEGLALWRARLGNECALAVVEPPYRAIDEDLVAAGRWSFADTFFEDVDAVASGVERLRGYVARNLPVDPERTVVAGAGAGGTAAVAAALQADALATTVFAIQPREFTRLADMPLPLPQLAGPEGPLARRVRVEARPEDVDWWQGELAQHAEVGIDAALEAPAADPWQVDLARERRIRAALGLPAPEPAPGARRVHVVGGSPRLQRWARIRAAEAGDVQLALLDAPPATDASAPYAPTPDPADLAQDAPPRCPGPFGGTSVLVLPDGLDAAARADWLALEEADPLAAASRFHRLRIATLGGERDLATVLETLRSENQLLRGARAHARDPRGRRRRRRAHDAALAAGSRRAALTAARATGPGPGHSDRSTHATAPVGARVLAEPRRRDDRAAAGPDQAQPVDSVPLFLRAPFLREPFLGVSRAAARHTGRARPRGGDQA